MSIGSLVYRNVTRRFSTLFLAATVGAFATNYVFNTATDAYWDRVNAGKQWKDIKATLEG
ncbi:Ubiquinol-cytochrome C reductase, UQCRX/QCR9 like protein [Oesophagostomum dentatum]|uniref:Complex III subunit 9 n=1 Tax=Oesophagostomum dentatum TaxID=61180 RepID=A0A0B1T056_OESDE|nr:Ubiquinol-cytochrome C reductase, UQCRX/QCR9 like protein [Oesophagostomum dentatum]